MFCSIILIMRHDKEINTKYHNSQLFLQIGASTFATNIGAPMFIGLAGSAAAGGIAVVMFEWHVRRRFHTV